MTRTLRIATLALVSLVALIAAGCGGSSSSSDKASSPLDEALSYLPKATPVVFTVDTNLKGTQARNAQGLLKKFPFGAQVENQIKQSLESSGAGLSFDQDIKPLLGNQLVVGAPSARAVQGDDDQFVLAIQAKNSDKLEGIFKKSGAKKDGDSNGATIYRTKEGRYTGVKDDVLVSADTKPQLESALKTRDGDSHFSQKDFDKGMAGVPKGGVVRVYTDVEGLVKASPDARQALRSKWVAAARTAGVNLSIEPDGVKADFHVATDSGSLSDADLPMASGSDAPAIVTQGDRFAFGLRGANQVVDFAEKTGQVVNPIKYGQFKTAENQIQQRLGVNLEKDVVDQLTGDTDVLVGLDGKFAARSELKDPAGFKRTMKKIGPILPNLVSGAVEGAKVSKPKGGLYTVSLPDGESIVFGQIKNLFVVGKDASEAQSIAKLSPTPPPGGKGAFALNANAATIAQRIVSQMSGGGIAGNLGGSFVTSALGDLTGSIQAETSGITGTFQLAVK